MPNLNIDQSFGLLKKLSKNSDGSNLTRSDIKKIINDADLNNDDILTSEEYEEFYKNNDTYKELEEDYLEAFDLMAALAAEEGDIQGLTLEDYEAAVGNIENVDENMAGGNAGTSTGGTTSTYSNQNKAKEESSDPKSLANKLNINELNSKRADALDTISKQREAKNQASAEAQAKTKETQKAYNDAMETLAQQLKAKENQMTEAENAIVDTQERQSSLNDEINNQNTVISDCTNQVNTCSVNVSNIQSQLSSLTEPPQTITEVDEEGNEVSITNPAYEEYLKQKEELEAQLKTATDELSQAEITLAQAEELLVNLEINLATIEENLQLQVDNYLQTEAQNDEQLKGLQEKIDTTVQAYNQAKLEKNNIIKPFDELIQSAQNDLKTYTEAIQIKETMPQESTEGKAQKPAETLDEFLASLDDPQAKKWFNAMFNELGYDYDTFWSSSNIPRDFQSLYTDRFSTGTIRSSGCGITSLSMLSEYLTGEYKSPSELTRGYTGDNPASALEKGLNDMGVNWTRCYGNDAIENLDAQLEAGKPVIVNVRKSSIFTEGGHFMVISGKTADGKYIVNDPNIENYLNPNMVDGFMNGFTKEQITTGLSNVIYFE